MKLTTLKTIFTRTATVAALATAALVATPAAHAQGVRIGVGIGFGHPVYAAPVYPGPVYAPGYGPGFYARRDAIIRHDEWVRAHEYNRYHRGFYR